MGDINKKNASPSDGIRSTRATGLFRLINFELYAKPNKAIMAVGMVAFLSTLGYIIYMRKKYEGFGYYAAIAEDGAEQYRKKQSKWD